MNTQQATKRTNYGVRQTTINKLCVALTELTSKVKADKPYKNLYDVFKAYSKRYKINRGLWYTMKNLGYISEDAKGSYIKVNRHEINQTMARLIISTFNEKAKERKGLRKAKSAKEEMPKQEETSKQEEPKDKEEKEKEVYLVFDHNHRFSQGSSVFNSLEEVQKIQNVGTYNVFKLVGALNVVAHATLHTDIKAEIKQAKPFDYEYGNDKNA